MRCFKLLFTLVFLSHLTILKAMEQEETKEQLEQEQLLLKQLAALLNSPITSVSVTKNGITSLRSRKPDATTFLGDEDTHESPRKKQKRQSPQREIPLWQILAFPSEEEFLKYEESFEPDDELPDGVINPVRSPQNIAEEIITTIDALRLADDQTNSSAEDLEIQSLLTSPRTRAKSFYIKPRFEKIQRKSKQ